MAEKTTDLSTIRKRPTEFLWGRVVSIADIGTYTVVEYIDQMNVGRFHVYVDGRDTCSSTRTLDEALILAIAKRNLLDNEDRYMAMAACKILNV